MYFFTYLHFKGRDKETHRALPPTGTLPRCPQQLGQAQVSRLKLSLSPSAGTGTQVLEPSANASQGLAQKKAGTGNSRLKLTHSGMGHGVQASIVITCQMLTPPLFVVVVFMKILKILGENHLSTFQQSTMTSLENQVLQSPNHACQCKMMSFIT